MKTLARTAFFAPPHVGRKVLTKSEWKLKERLRTNEKALRGVLMEMRDKERSIEDYNEGERGLLWVRYILVPSGACTPGMHKPTITINLRSVEQGMKVDGTSRLINVVFDRYIDMSEWKKLLDTQIEIRLRGWKSKERVYKAAVQLLSESSNPILSMSPASAHTDKEEEIDFFLICNGHSGVEKVPLQCKTGAFGQIAHRSRASGVPSLLIHPGMSDDEIRDKLRIIVKRFLEGDVIHV